jgi:hypothetical protein
MKPIPYATLEKAMLPLDGTIAPYVPAILDAYAEILPRARWAELEMIDYTSGSCLMPMGFAAAGAKRVTINDAAARSHLAASFLFGGRKIDPERVEALLAVKRPTLRPHVPTFHFACDYLIEPVCDVFDRLYHAPVPQAERAGLRYLAIRWALGFAPSMVDGFDILYTHDPKQLRAMADVDWKPYLARAANPRKILRDLVRDLNASIDAVGRKRFAIHVGDMKDLAKTLRPKSPCFVAVNPPTRGLDEYTIDDQLVHSLMENRWLPLSRTSESPLDFWVKRVDAALRPLPKGAHFMVWGGDGSMSFDACRKVWEIYGSALYIKRLRPAENAPGWGIFEAHRKSV